MSESTHRHSGERQMPIRKTDEDMLTVAEAAHALGITPSTLRTAIQKGSLRAVALTPRINVIPLSEVERYQRESLGQPGPKRKVTDPPTTSAVTTNGEASRYTDHRTGTKP